MDQGSTKKRSAVHNCAPTVTKFCVMWEGQALPHGTKFGNCRCEIVGRRVIFIWSLIHGSSWSGLIKAEPGVGSKYFHMILESLQSILKRPWSHFSVGVTWKCYTCNRFTLPSFSVEELRSDFILMGKLWDVYHEHLCVCVCMCGGGCGGCGGGGGVVCVCVCVCGGGGGG